MKLILLINTGRTYRDALTTGVKANRSIKISCAGALLSILNPGEPFYMKDNNGSIDATDFVIETVNTDGTTISSGSGLAAKCLILQ